MNEIKGPAHCPHYQCSSNFWNMLIPWHKFSCVYAKNDEITLMIHWTDAISWHRTQCSSFSQSYLSSYYTSALNVNLFWITAAWNNCKNINVIKMWMFVLDRHFSVRILSGGKTTGSRRRDISLSTQVSWPLIKSRQIWKNVHHCVGNWAFHNVLQAV